ncbi:Pleiotropic drug resistance protein tur2 [Asimina triloba]
MDNADLYSVGSLRRNGSQWKNTTAQDVFSRSARDEDDEEALKWAALEKLPTYNRLRKGILSGVVPGQLREVDIKNLEYHERKNLLERLIKVTEEDNENFLLKLKQRIDRVGIEIPTVEVRYEHLNIEAEVRVGSRALPSMFNFTYNFIEGFLNSLNILPSRKKPMSILHDVSGFIKPRRLTLLLGPPGSGKTTLLLALAGKLDPELEASGRITYNGHGMDEFVPQRTSAYISQNDVHIGEMTVRETLAFSARCQGVGTNYDLLMELSRREKEANIKPDPDLDVFMKAASLAGQKESVVVDYILKILGLEVCADTMVGDQMLRGISGGQKKRVTTGEMLVGPSKAFFMDEISTGLDSSTTFQIVNCLRQSIHILGMTAVIALLQPAPETYNLFDDIILLSDGQIVYQGPREHVLEFFESMGFKCPDRKGVADFLQEVTSIKDQEQYWANKDEPYRYIPVKEFADAYQSFHAGRKVSDELKVPFDKSKGHPAALTTTKYGISKMELLKACAAREWLLMKRNSFVYFFKIFQNFALALLTHINMFLVAEDIKKWWIWGYWISPLMYGQNAIATNEFLGKSWRHVTEFSTESLGIQVLKARGIFTDSKWYWIGVGALIGYMFLFNGLFTASLAFLNPYKTSKAVLSEETLMEKHANRTGETEGIELSSRGKGSALHSKSAGSSSHSTPIEAADEVNKNKKGMVLPFAPLSLTFDNVIYSVDIPQEMKAQGITEDRLVLLKGVSGAFRPGVLTALMGVSGAGKTTLMDVLAGRKTGGYIEGDIRISGYSKKQETFARVSGYCEQNDIHSPHVTVYESLLYSAWLRLPSDVSSDTRKVSDHILDLSNLKGNHTRVLNPDLITSANLAGQENHTVYLLSPQMFIEEVMDLVELNSLRDALVGLPGVSGLSTEQRKRLTIAVELVANPSIIFMDEPTSGLDARAAAIVMRTVRNTVDTGRTVVCTIHQPSIDIFESFDELFLMKRGGEEIYVGPLGHNSCQLVNYFESIDGVSRIKDDYNPATWMLEVSSVAQEDILGINFAEVYKNSDLYRKNKALIKEQSSPSPGSKDLYFSTQYSQSFITQCLACLWKQRMSYWRNPPYTAVRVLFTIFIALMFGTIFWDLGTKTSRQQDLFNAMGSMYVAVLFLGIQNAGSVQPVVAVERTVFYRERAAGMYSALPYAFAQVAIELPYIFFQTLLYGVIVYAMIAFDWTVAKFLWYFFFMYFTLLYFTFYGMMAVGLTPNHEIAAIVSAAFYAIWNLFSGFLIPRPRIPVWWRWYYWACPVAWTLYGLIGSQFGDNDSIVTETGVSVSTFVRTYFGYKHDFLGVVAAAVIGFTSLFAFVFAWSIKFVTVYEANVESNESRRFVYVTYCAMKCITLPLRVTNSHRTQIVSTAERTAKSTSTSYLHTSHLSAKKATSNRLSQFLRKRKLRHPEP